MAWLYKQKGKSQNWWLGYRVNGKQVLRSTGTSDDLQAQRELNKVESLFTHHRDGSLTEELYRALTGKGLPSVTLAAELDAWLDQCRQNTAPSTFSRYQSVAKEFREFLNATEKGPLLANVTTADVSRFLVHKRNSTAASTSNVLRKILAAFFKRAITEGRLRDNPAAGIKRFKAQKGERVKKRSFTLDELGKLYQQAPDDFWRYMIVGEFYTGLRMGDLICLKWGNIDLAGGMITVEPDKVEGKEIHLPIAKVLRELLTARKAAMGDVKPKDYIWPDQADRHQRYVSGSGWFSNQFYNEILVPCGLAPKRETSHKAVKSGRDTKRQLNEVSFHCLRHSFVSFLKSTGSNQAIAKELAGHSSDAVNDLYTHVPEAALVAAINQLPEFTTTK